MANLPELIILAAVMGLSIFISLPVVMSRRITPMRSAALNAFAIGILLFLLGDIFSDIAPLLAGSQPYLTIPAYDAIFVFGVGGAFLVLFAAEHRPSGTHEFSPLSTALVVALAIGFQNLTEGLLFGSLWSAGTWVGFAFFGGLLGVIFLGFFVQNITEGFPIVAPLLGQQRSSLRPVIGFFLIGGLPTVGGAIVGYYWNSAALDILFDSVAIGAILYAILPMLRVAFRPASSPDLTYAKQRITYLGLLVGFLIGFVVNAL
jgi:ZIP family zinc transporter